MKKQQKIIELRTAAKLKIAELETQIAVARSEAAEKRARLMCDRAADLEGLEVNSIERFAVLAKYRAVLSWIDAKLAADVAECKLEIQRTKSECEQQCAEAEDDTEPDKEQPQQETVYCDGSEHSARIVARRLINKMPHIHKGGSLSIGVCRLADGAFFVSVTEIGENTDTFIATTFSKYDGMEKEAEFLEKARKLFDSEPESGNSHVAEPLSRALDAVFGGNPVEQVDNLISDTVKDRKEGENE